MAVISFLRYAMHFRVLSTKQVFLASVKTGKACLTANHGARHINMAFKQATIRRIRLLSGF